MKLAFYKAAGGTLWDRAIGWWTRSPYSHVELGLIPMGSTHLSFSSSPRDGGVRFKEMDYDPAKWDVVEIGGDDAAAYYAGRAYLGKRYDWAGIAGFVLPFGQHDDGDRFCSEVCVCVLQDIGVMPKGISAWKVSPGELYWIASSLAKAKLAA